MSMKPARRCESHVGGMGSRTRLLHLWTAPLSSRFGLCSDNGVLLLETYLQDYIEAAGLAGDREGPLFCTAYRRTGVLTDRPMTQSDAWRMPQRRARDAGIPTAVCNHTFRATGITQWRLP